MPITFPQRRPGGINRKLTFTFAAAYAVAMLLLLWSLLGPVGKPSLLGAAQVTTGIAPADQSGKPLAR